MASEKLCAVTPSPNQSAPIEVMQSSVSTSAFFAALKKCSGLGFFVIVVSQNEGNQSIRCILVGNRARLSLGAVFFSLLHGDVQNFRHKLRLHGSSFGLLADDPLCKVVSQGLKTCGRTFGLFRRLWSLRLGVRSLVGGVFLTGQVLTG